MTKTMQTEAPLVEANLAASRRPLDWFVSLRARGESGLDLNQPYQRGDVWGIVRRRNLIRSLLLGVPIPAVVINDRMGGHFRERTYSQERRWAYAVVDGKQRVTTFLMWFNDEFAVPASWLDGRFIETTEDTEDGPYVRYSGLSQAGQRRFSNHFGIAVVEGKLPSLADEQAIFDLVNFGGVAQGEKDED